MPSSIALSIELPELSNESQTFLDEKIEPEKTNILFFYSRTCPHCEKVVESGVLDSLNSSYKVIKLGVDDVPGREIFLSFCNIFKSKREFYYGAVPTLIKLDLSNITNSITVQGDSPIINFINSGMAEVNEEKAQDNKSELSLLQDNKSELSPFKLIWLVFITAISDSVNPCIMSVLALLISQLMLFKAKKRIKKYSLIYIMTIYVSYFIIGVLLALGLNAFLTKTSTAVNSVIGFYVLLGVAIIVIFAGIVNIKDFFAYGKGISFSLSDKSKKRVTELIQKLSLPSIIALGIIITIIEFPCSGIMYAGLISLLMLNNISFVGLLFILIVYNFIFVLPLIFIVYSITQGGDVSSVNATRLKYRKWFRLIMGIVLVGLGIYLIKMIL